MSILDSAGGQSTFLLPAPLESGRILEIEKRFINVQDIEEIVLRTFSIDGWKMETIEIFLMGSTYLFTNQNEQTIDKYSGQVSFMPV